MHAQKNGHKSPCALFFPAVITCQDLTVGQAVRCWSTSLSGLLGLLPSVSIFGLRDIRLISKSSLTFFLQIFPSYHRFQMYQITHTSLTICYLTGKEKPGHFLYIY